MAKKSSSRKSAKRPVKKATKKAAPKAPAKRSKASDDSRDILLRVLKRLDSIEARLGQLSRPAASAGVAAAIRGPAAAAAAAAAAAELPDEVNDADDVEAIVITITERRTGIKGVTRDTSFADDLGLTTQATKGLFIPIRDAIIERGKEIQGFTSNDFAGNDTVGDASDALAGAIPGLDE